MADGGGTYGSPTKQVPSGGGGNRNSDPLAATGMTRDDLSASVMGNFNNQVLPTDRVYVGNRAMGYTKGRGLGVALGAPQADQFTPGPSRGIAADNMLTYDAAQNLPATWYATDPKFYKQFLNKLILYKYPGAGSDWGLPEVGQAWDALLQASIKMNKANAGKNNWTPWDVLNSYNRPAGSLGTRKSGDWLIDIATGEKVKYVGPKTKTTKQSVLDLSNPEQVQALATQTLTQMIGRAPTDKELAQFKASLNGYERENPEITTSTEHYDDMGNVTATDVVRSGGVTDATRAGVIGQGVQKTKEYGKYQSGTTYFNALMQMMGGG